MSWSGAALLVIATFYVNDVFVGVHLLLPTIGAALIIFAGTRSWLNIAILSRAPAVFVGKISFPLYLWHWPLLYFYRTMPLGKQSAVGTITTLFLAALLSALTYFLIERPLRHAKKRRVPLFISSAAAALAMIAIGVFGAKVIQHDGFPEARTTIDLFPLQPEQAKLKAQVMKVFELRYDYGFAKLYGDKPCFRFKESQTIAMFVENGCMDQQYPGRPNVFILGDSHAAALSLGLSKLLSSHRINVERMTYGWCEPTDDRKDAICDGLNAAALAKISELKPDLLIVDAYWVAAAIIPYYHGSDYATALLSFLSDMRARGAKHVIVVGQMSTYNHSLPERLIEDYIRKGLQVPERVKSADPLSIETDSMMRRLPYPPGVDYVSLRDELCDAEGCLAFVGPNIEADMLLWDYGHLTANGSDFVARTVLEPVASRLLPELAGDKAVEVTH
jgi:hypothetical protein